MANSYVWGYKSLKSVLLTDASDLHRIITIDAELFANNPKAYVKDNLAQYELATNLWLYITSDFVGPNLRDYVFAHMKDNGLCRTIKEMNGLANDYISYQNDEFETSACVPPELYFLNNVTLADGLDIFNCAKSRVADVLQALRFLKRFSPFGMDALVDEKLNAFKDVNFDEEHKDKRRESLIVMDGVQVNTATYPKSRAPYDATGRAELWPLPTVMEFYKPTRGGKLRTVKGGLVPKTFKSKQDYLAFLKKGHWVECVFGNTADPMPMYTPDHRPSQYLIDRVKDVIRCMMKGYSSPDYSRIQYSNGASQDVCTCTLCKEIYKSQLENPSPYISVDYDYVPMMRTEYQRVLDNGLRKRPLDKYGRPFYAVKLHTVPKDYKGPRIIAPEAFDRQARMKAIADELDRVILKNGYEEYLPFHDQSVNQLNALLGACYGTYATIDSSHASDSVTKSMVWDLFPHDIASDMLAVMPTHYSDGKAVMPLHIFGTMGSALTFKVESIIFLAIALAAIDICTPEKSRKAKYQYRVEVSGHTRPSATAFGDDITVVYGAAETTVNLLTALGFSVNLDKTFITGCYRESCGKEFYGYRDEDTGFVCYDLTSTYWPRKDMSVERENELQMTYLELNNRLYDVGKHRTNECMAHAFMRMWLEERYKVAFVPESIAPEGALIGDATVIRVKDLLTGEKFLIPFTELSEHPSYRALCTTATNKKLVPSSDKRICVHTQLTWESIERFWSYNRYQHFLEFGPEYDDEVCGSLSVPTGSTPSLKLNQATGKSVMCFRTFYGA